MAERKPLSLVAGAVKELTASDTLPVANIPAVIAPQVHAADVKTTPADADELGYLDSAGGSWGLVKTTWGAIKTALASVFVGKSGSQVMSGDLTIPSLNGGQLAGLRNKIINGGFAINQRAYVSGASTSAGQYTLDRWKVTGSSGLTFSAIANKTTVTIPSGQTLQQVVEGLSLQSGSYVLSWDGTAQGLIAGGSYGASGAVSATVTGGTNTTIEFNAGTVANVQLETGPVATAFEYRLLGLELMLCQRYYYRITPGASAAFGILNAVTTSGGNANVYTPVIMRAAPTSLEQSGTASDYSVSGNICTAVPVYAASSDRLLKASFGVAAVLTAAAVYSANSSAAGAYLGWSAEL